MVGRVVDTPPLLCTLKQLCTTHSMQHWHGHWLPALPRLLPRHIADRGSGWQEWNFLAWPGLDKQLMMMAVCTPGSFDGCMRMCYVVMDRKMWCLEPWCCCFLSSFDVLPARVLEWIQGLLRAMSVTGFAVAQNQPVVCTHGGRSSTVQVVLQLVVGVSFTITCTLLSGALSLLLL